MDAGSGEDIQEQVRLAKDDKSVAIRVLSLRKVCLPAPD